MDDREEIANNHKREVDGRRVGRDVSRGRRGRLRKACKSSWARGGTEGGGAGESGRGMAQLAKLLAELLAEPGQASGRPSQSPGRTRSSWPSS